jgi:murein DD-endopeptidase MepM/ murein hydrolase activator NlpD
MKKIILAFLLVSLVFASGVTGETLDEGVLRSGCVIGNIDMPNSLTPGETYTINWMVQSYVDVRSRFQIIYSDNISEKIEGNLYDKKIGRYYISNHQSYEYYFSIEYTVPDGKSGDARVGFHNSQNDGAWWMYSLFPTGVIDRPYGTAGKQFYVKIIANSGEPVYEPVSWNNYQYPITPYVPGSYGGRSFYYDNIHLGEDINLTEGTAIRAIADGKILEYRNATGYGNLVVIIEHEVDATVFNDNSFHFYNGQMKTKTLTGNKFCAIYGHLRKGNLSWSKGNYVSKGDIIGYVENDVYNGDGAEHLHLGIFAGENPNTWAFCGYKSNGTYPKCVVGKFVSGKELIDKLKTGIDVFDFWLKTPPYHHSTQTNFDSQFKLKNVTNNPVTVEKWALAIHKEDGSHLFDLKQDDNPMTIQAGESTAGLYGEGVVWNAGNYKVVAKIYMKGQWIELATQTIQVD